MKKFSEINVLQTGFRIFFLGASAFSIVVMTFWLGIFVLQIALPNQFISVISWHSHEMIYGYTLAVIAGFLLTAVKNWTGVQTLRGSALATLFAFWLGARLFFTLGYALAAGIFDILFLFFLLFAVTLPIVKIKQWKRIPIVLIVFLISACSLLFYLSVLRLEPLDILGGGIFWGIYGGLYLIIGLLLVITRLVIPFFIERGVGYQVQLFNSKLLDRANALLFLGFFSSVMIWNNAELSAYLALALFLVNSIKLIGWHTHGIWRKSLLWSLYLSSWFICVGFLLYAGTYFYELSLSNVLHTFTFGGIGLLTLSMMTRVSTGHTGRDLKNPPKAMSVAFVFLILGSIVRVFVSLLLPQFYSFWIGISQVLWILSFLIFFIIFTPILLRPRIDGRYG